MNKLTDKITELPGVGQAYQKRLKRLGIRRIRDLLFHYPSRYLDFSQITPISRLFPGQTAAISGQVVAINNRPAKKQKMIITEAIVQDQSNSIKVMWFYQPYLENLLAGREVLLAGKVERHRELLMVSPEYELKKRETTHIGRIVPIYPETRKVSSKWLRSKTKSIVEMTDQITDFLPKNIKKQYRLVGLNRALKEIHFPVDQARLKAAKERLAFDELFLIALQGQRRRAKLREFKAPKLEFHKKKSQEFVKSLPFKLTEAQRRSAWQILLDLERGQPMNRLLNGDVGSGKTVVAAIAILNTVLSEHQAVLMAPTEVLARQHFQTLKDLFKGLNFKIDLYTASQKTIDLSKNKTESQLIIGTHALIQEKVRFGKLGLVIVDEQHRFGVEQRAKLIESKRFWPHFLTMTATPIPRTLSLALYGDLDISLLDQVPQERKKIITRIVSPKDRQSAYQFVREEVEKGRQVFVICPLIEEKEGKGELWDEQKSVEREYQKLKEEIFPDLRIGYLHGRLKPKEKERVMKEFRDKKKDILVSTSVVEVGVDIRNASLMMIEGAERFGLSQLHQFRGRVGRSSHQSYCLLLPTLWSKKVRERLRVISSTSDGFKIAREDLKMRGPGEIYGQRQHGLVDLKMASLFDLEMIKKAREAAKEIGPRLENYPQLEKRLDVFQNRVHLE